MNILFNNENKKKFLVLTLCFTLVFTSINYKKSYADGGIISLPLLATVSALAVGAGIVIKNNDDLYDMGKMFVDYIKSNNQAMSDVLNVFATCVSVGANNMINVGSEFLDIVKGFFDKTFGNSYIAPNGLIEYVGNIPFQDGANRTYVTRWGASIPYPGNSNFIINDVVFEYLRSTSSSNYYKYSCGSSTYEISLPINSYYSRLYFGGVGMNKYVSNSVDVALSTYASYDNSVNLSSSYYLTTVYFSSLTGNFDFPYSGGYDWDNVKDKQQEGTGDLPLPIPGNVGNLVGQSGTDFWDNTDGLVGNGDLTAPNVSNPSIDLDGSTSFPNTGTGEGDITIPNTGIWADIKAFVIGLVVPSDAFWTDTFGGLYNNFVGAFPGVDMGAFDSLATDGKPFPNIYVTLGNNLGGAKGKIVDGDTVNSIVDWLRPIIAGFIMLMLMFFNYRKIYKMIRNSDPIPGIASSGSSEFDTGLRGK